MAISFKSTIIFSATLAALLNAYQFASSYQQRQDALAPAFAYAAAKTRAPRPMTSTAKSPASLPTRTPVPIVSSPRPSVATVPPPSPTDVNIATQLANHGFNANFAALYLSVSQQTGTPWQLLAAVHKVETGQSGDTDRTSYAGATGPMQFLPATFYSYAAPGAADIDSVQDAVLAAGRYLSANGASRGDYSNAIYHYNHSWSYVSRVLDLADSLGL